MKQGFNDQITDLVQIEIPRLLKDLLKEAFQTKPTALPPASLPSCSSYPARTTSHDDVPTSGLTVVQPAVSSIVLINGQSVSPAAKSNCRWKIPFIHTTIVCGSTPPPAIFAITETWLKDYISDAQVSIKGYNVYRSDRDKRKGGGSLLYLHDQLLVKEVTRYKDRENNMVCCYIESSHTLIASIYRPPDSNPSGFSSLLSHLQETVDRISDSHRMPDVYPWRFQFPRD